MLYILNFVIKICKFYKKILDNFSVIICFTTINIFFNLNNFNFAFEQIQTMNNYLWIIHKNFQIYFNFKFWKNQKFSFQLLLNFDKSDRLIMVPKLFCIVLLWPVSWKTRSWWLISKNCPNGQCAKFVDLRRKNDDNWMSLTGASMTSSIKMTLCHKSTFSCDGF